MRAIALAVILLGAFDGFCQTQMKETDALQSLLVEVRQLRQDIEAMTVTSQRVQIALSALQMQDAAVARATQRADNARIKCVSEEVNRQYTASETQRLEGSLATETVPESQDKVIQSRLSEMKSALERQTTEVQTCQVAEAEASSQLRNEQTKLTDLQDRIERLDKTLEKASASGK
jgi:chromosome segregation ATPase